MLCNHMICPPLVSLKLFWDVVIFYRTGHPCRWLGFNGSLLRRFLLDAKGENAAVLTPQWPVENPGRDVQLPCDLLWRQMEDCAGLFWPSLKNKVLRIVWVADIGRLWPYKNHRSFRSFCKFGGWKSLMLAICTFVSPMPGLPTPSSDTCWLPLIF